MTRLKNFKLLSEITFESDFALNFVTCQDRSTLGKSVSTIFKKTFSFNFICVLVFFQKYATTSVYKNKICLAGNFKTTA